jgi:hypothetical protein
MRQHSVRVAQPSGSENESNRTGSPTALSNFIQATLRISQENTAAAEEALKQLHKRRPVLAELSARAAANGNDIDSRRLLAEAYMEEELLPFAFQMYQEIQSIKPDDSSAEVGVARLWDRWGDFDLGISTRRTRCPDRSKIGGGPEALGRIHLHRNLD